MSELSCHIFATLFISLIANSELNLSGGSCSASCCNVFSNLFDVGAIKLLFLTSTKQSAANKRFDNPSFFSLFPSSKNALLLTFSSKRKSIVSATNLGSIIPEISRKTSCQDSSCQCFPNTSWINCSIVSVCSSLNCQTNSHAQKYSKKVRCTKPYESPPRSQRMKLRVRS